MDKDGVLDRVEAGKFLRKCMLEASGIPPSEDDVERNFALMDLDGSGDIDKEEAFRFIKGYKIGQKLMGIMAYASDNYKSTGNN